VTAGLVAIEVNKHVCVTTHTWTNIYHRYQSRVEPLKEVTSTWFAESYKKGNRFMNSSRELHVEAGLNTSAIALWVIGGDEKGSLESETVKYGHKSDGTLTQKGFSVNMEDLSPN
jgi:hypothetical protein